MMPGLAGEAVGWDGLSRFNWFGSLMFAGGTLVDPIVNAAYSFSAARKMLGDQNLSPEEQFAIARFPDVVQGIPVNPYGGVMRTTQGIMEAVNSATPTESFFEFILTNRIRGGAHPTQVREFQSGLEAGALEMRRQMEQQFPGQFRQEGITAEEWQGLQEVLRNRTESMPGGGSRQ
jgi:hypothetical protein